MSFLPGMFPGAIWEAFDASFINTYSSTSDTNSYTFSSSAIGAARPDRLVVVVALGRDVNPVALSSATIGGSAATINVNSSTSSGRSGAAIFSRVVAAGSTADIVVTWDEAITACKIFVYRVVGYRSATPTDTYVSNSTSNVTSLTASIDTLAGGAVIGGAMLNNAQTLFVGTGKINSQAAVESIQYAGFSHFPASTATPASLLISWNGSLLECAAAVAHWQAA